MGGNNWRLSHPQSYAWPCWPNNGTAHRLFVPPQVPTEVLCCSFRLQTSERPKVIQNTQTPDGWVLLPLYSLCCCSWRQREPSKSPNRFGTVLFCCYHHYPNHCLLSWVHLWNPESWCQQVPTFFFFFCHFAFKLNCFYLLLCGSGIISFKNVSSIGFAILIGRFFNRAVYRRLAVLCLIEKGHLLSRPCKNK